MARTPLLARLQQLAVEQDAAYTRREFLRRAGAAGAAVAVPGPLLPRLRTRPRIAIVGGGIAGLTAALTLQDHGVAATVYESSSRVGGRMHSNRSGYWDDGQVSEWCGELIDSGHKTILALARRFHLQVDDVVGAQPRGTTDTYVFDGTHYPVAAASRDFRPVYATLRRQLRATGYPTLWNRSTKAGRALDRMSVHEWIARFVPGGHRSPLGALLDAAYTEEYGADTRIQSSLNLVYLLGYQPGPGFHVFGSSDEHFHIRGGNEQLPRAIARELHDVRTRMRLTAIRRHGDAVTLRFGDETVVADHVLLCMSFSVLRTLDYRGSGLDADARKQRAIRELGSGRNAKLQLQFDTRYWNSRGSNGNVYTDLGFQNTWDVTRAQPGVAGILVDYSGGAHAESLAASRPYSTAADPYVRAHTHTFLAQLERVFPGISKRWNGKATLSTPFRDPNLLCSYSFWKVGQYTSFAGYEKQPIGRIHFAGEHCSQDFQGFMEGAASEGVRAAHEILAAVRR